MKKLVYHYYPGWSTTQEVFDGIINPEGINLFNEEGYTDQFPQQHLDGTADILMAYSLGCLKALEQSQKYPPKALILFSPFLSFIDNDDKIAQQLRAMQTALHKDKNSLINSFQLQASFPDTNIYSNYNDWQVSSLLAGIDELINSNFDNELLKKITCPVLIFQGKDDCINDLQKVKKVQQALPRSQLKILDGGHSLLLNHCNECKQLIKSFLTQDAQIQSTSSFLR